MNTRLMFSSKTDLWETPQWLFDELDREFHFTLDVCALPENAKCERYYTPEMDGLAQPWNGVCWCTLWPHSGGVGAEGKGDGCCGAHGGDAPPGQDRHALVPRGYLQAGTDRGAVSAREAAVRRGREQRPVSLDGGGVPSAAGGRRVRALRDV